MIWPMVPWVRGASPRSPSGKSSRLAVKKCLFMVNVVTLIRLSRGSTQRLAGLRAEAEHHAPAHPTAERWLVPSLTVEVAQPCRRLQQFRNRHRMKRRPVTIRDRRTVAQLRLDGFRHPVNVDQLRRCDVIAHEPDEQGE